MNFPHPPKLLEDSHRRFVSLARSILEAVEVRVRQTASEAVASVRAKRDAVLFGKKAWVRF